jgi:arginase
VGYVGSWTLLGVPLYTSTRQKGMRGGPSALRKAGIGQALKVQSDLGDISFPPLERDALEGRVSNISYFRGASSTVYARAKTILTDQAVIVGGECSETVGAVSGLAETFPGKPGMLWMDAHGDFNTAESTPSGYIGGMCLAMVCGRTPGLGLDYGTNGPPTNGPPIAEERLVHLGSRALDPAEVSAFNSSPAKLFTSQQVKARGASEVAEEAARHLDNRSDWIVCHLDVDVLDPTIVPSVSYLTPGGLSLDEVSVVMRALIKTEKLRVLELTAYNPSKDHRGASAKIIVDLVRDVFS